MRKSISAILAVIILVVPFLWSTAANAASYIYGNNATGGTDYAYKIDASTYTVVDTYTNLTGINGRGVVVVNGIMYYTNPSSGSVNSYNTATHTDNGVLFSIAGTSSLSAIAYDGTNFWVADYSGTNQAYQYTTTGTLLQTIHLANAVSQMDGLEFFLQGGTTPRLIANRADGCCTNPTIYDVYDLNGNLIQAAFITVPDYATGIAYDGTNFLISLIFTGSISKYDGATGTLISTTAITGAPSGYPPAIEDLSADYAVVLNLFSVTYNGNGNTGGTVPVDGNSPYNSGATVTVLGNTGALVKTGSTFAGWNTAADGSGTSYSPGNTFAITANTTLYAMWTVVSPPPPPVVPAPTLGEWALMLLVLLTGLAGAYTLRRRC